MTRDFLLLLPLLAISFAQSNRLRFGSDGTFKINQFADIHYANGELSGCSDILPSQRPCTDVNSTIFIGRVLDGEKPNLAVFTGDNISGPRNAEAAIKAYSQPAYSRSIPWAMVFGNHDQEANLNREEMMKVTLSLPFSLSQRGPSDVFGVGNYVIELFDALGKNVFNLYFLDSGDYSKNPAVSGYEWIRPSQIKWFLDKSKELKERNGKVVPALMFFHIPIPEYELVTDIVGDKQEGIYDANVNSGLFSAILEAGDVKATFVGHDHVNDFCGKHLGIFLCYGGGTGYRAYGKAGWDRRSRVIQISNNGNKITTWKRLDDAPFSLINQQTLFQV